MSTPAAVVLIGPMGAGKTSIGKRVAKRLGVPFFDTDVAIVREHGPIDALFADHGETRFRDLERAAVHTGLARGGIVSLGGGAVLHPETQAELAGHHVVLLTVSPRTVGSRIRGSKRPLLQGEDPLARWLEVYESRRGLYEELAEVTFDTSTGPLQDIVDALTEWVQENT